MDINTQVMHFAKVDFETCICFTSCSLKLWSDLNEQLISVFWQPFHSNYSKIPKTLHQNDNVVVFLDMMVYRISRTFGFISIIASFLSNLYRSDGEGYLTLADIGDEWSLQGLVRLSPGRMNKTSTKLKFHLLVFLFQYRQDKMLYTTVFSR